jgi:Fe-S-cluster containining protein
MSLKDAVEHAAGRAEVVDAVARVYHDLQGEIDARKPVCKTSGRCCRFEEFGHRLYVTTIELAAFVHDLPGRAGPSPGRNARPGDGPAPPTGCPFQVEGLCTVHAIRPFGCRIFFCDASSNEWQIQQYERFHARIKRIHEEMCVPYFYVEWREALQTLGLAVRQTASGKPAAKQGGLSLGQLRL